MNPEIKKYLSEIGRKGGQSKSDSKRAAGKINAAKATAARKGNKTQINSSS